MFYCYVEKDQYMIKQNDPEAQYFFLLGNTFTFSFFTPPNLITYSS